MYKRQSYIYQAAQEFADRASEYSDGTLEFTVSGNGSLYGGDTAAGIKQLSAGSLQMLILASSVYASFEPGYNVISVPYMFDDQQQLLDYLNSDTGKELMNRVSDMGITTVGSWTRSFRKITNSKNPVNKPEDLKGMVLRVPNNALYVEFFGACGAVTVSYTHLDVYKRQVLRQKRRYQISPVTANLSLLWRTMGSAWMRNFWSMSMIPLSGRTMSV